MFEVLIRGGVVADGTGAAPYAADVGICDGKIAAVGKLADQPSAKTIDAAGCFVTPGFIDVHRHADTAVLRPGFGEIELAQGITTIVNGQCGLSAAPCPEPHRKEIMRFLEPVLGAFPEEPFFAEMPEYLTALKRTPLALNVGMCIGNGTLRMAARGFANGALTREEQEAVHRRLRAALGAGVMGVTMGIVYAPENCYDQSGLVEALAPMREYNVPLVMHIRGYGDLLHASLREAVSIAKALQVPLHISHMMAVGRRNWGEKLRQGLQILEQAQQEGLQVTCDAYPYTAGSSQLIQILPPWFQEGGVDAIVARLSDPVQRAELKEILKKPQTRFENLVDASGWDALLITTVGSEANQYCVGKTIADIAAMQGKAPDDCALDLLVEERCNITMVIFITREEDIIQILKKPYSHVISDSVYPKSGLPHPRLYGAFPKILSEYVRDRKLLALPQAVRKMTSAPAGLYRMGTKGLVREGYDADLAVFALEEVGCDADYLDPARPAQGMKYVLVNGSIAFAHGQKQCKNAGGLLLQKRQ